MSFIVHVVNDDQEPVRGVAVALEITTTGILSSSAITPREYTDSDGQAFFDLKNWDDWYPTDEIFLDGHSYGEYPFGDGESVTITI